MFLRQEIGSFLLDMMKINQDVHISEAELSKMVDEVIKNFDDNNDGKQISKILRGGWKILDGLPSIGIRVNIFAHFRLRIVRLLVGY